MNLSIGNLARRETNISVMPQDSYMPFQKIWLDIYQLTSKFSLTIFKGRKKGESVDPWIDLSCICPLQLFIVILGIIIAGMFFTSTLMRMSHWVHGLLVWMWNTSMIGDYVVAPHLVNF